MRVSYPVGLLNHSSGHFCQSLPPIPAAGREKYDQWTLSHYNLVTVDVPFGRRYLFIRVGTRSLSRTHTHCEYGRSPDTHGPDIELRP